MKLKLLFLIMALHGLYSQLQSMDNELFYKCGSVALLIGAQQALRSSEIINSGFVLEGDGCLWALTQRDNEQLLHVARGTEHMVTAGAGSGIFSVHYLRYLLCKKIDNDEFSFNTTKFIPNFAQKLILTGFGYGLFRGLDIVCASINKINDWREKRIKQEQMFFYDEGLSYAIRISGSTNSESKKAAKRAVKQLIDEGANYYGKYSLGMFNLFYTYLKCAKNLEDKDVYNFIKSKMMIDLKIAIKKNPELPELPNEILDHIISFLE
jgi:hypothetical protein